MHNFTVYGIVQESFKDGELSTFVSPVVSAREELAIAVLEDSFNKVLEKTKNIKATHDDSDRMKAIEFDNGDVLKWKVFDCVVLN